MLMGLVVYGAFGQLVSIQYFNCMYIVERDQCTTLWAVLTRARLQVYAQCGRFSGHFK